MPLDQILEKIGLKENEAKVYLALLQVGTTHAGRIVIETGLAKSSVYNALEYLINRGLANKYIHGSTTKYTAEDPTKLEYILGQEAKQVRTKQEELAKILPQLYGIKNPHSLLPKVRMYEGIEGVRMVGDDAYTAKEEICEFFRIDELQSEVPEMAEYNQEHLKKRLELGVRKKILFPDSELAREIERDYDRELTEIKVMPRKEYMFHSATLIYDGKVSLFTYRERTAIGILIEDEEIYNFHKYIFDVIWDSC